MRFKCFVFVLCVFCYASTAQSQSRGIIRCDQNAGKISVLMRPGSTFVIGELACGQEVVIAGMEQEHYLVRTATQVGYVPNRSVILLDKGQPQTDIKAITEDKITEPSWAPNIPRTEDGPKKAQEVRSIQGIKERRHEGSIYFELSHIYYGEASLMRNKGFMYGLSGDYTYRPNNFMLRIDGRFSTGTVDYWSAETGYDTGLRDYNFETRFTAGYGFRSKNGIVVFTPYSGLGYRYLFDGEEGAVTSTGARDYDRKSNYLYSPIGFETLFRPRGRWAFGLTGEYDLFWHGWQYSEIGDDQLDPFGLIVLKDWVLKNDQEDGWGARWSVKIIRNMGRIDFSVEPYMRYWSINDSDRLTIQFLDYYYQSWEPKNSTMEWGIRVGMRF